MKRLKSIGGFLFAFALGVAVFAFARNSILGQPASASDPPQLIKEIAVEDEICDVNNICETFSGTLSIDFAEAEGLPELSPDMMGLYLDYSGDVLTIGTGNISVEVNVEQVNDNEPVTAVSATHSGEELEIIVNSDTQVFADVTVESEPSREDFEAGSMTVQRVVEAGDLADLSDNMMIRAWGTMQGDEFVAQYLVYEPIR